MNEPHASGEASPLTMNRQRRRGICDGISSQPEGPTRVLSLVACPFVRCVVEQKMRR